MLKYASEFGMTPSSRSRIIAKDSGDEKDAELLKVLMGGSVGEKKG